MNAGAWGQYSTGRVNLEFLFILGLLLANWLGLEVVDMDGRRVDKVLVRPAGEVQVEPSTDATSGATDPSAN